MKQFANIIIDISVKSLDKPFTYQIPDEFIMKVDIGSVVKIPFGAGNREIKGYVIEIVNKTNVPLNKIKYIKSVHEAYEVETQLIKLASWMKKRYQCSFVAALNTIIPTGNEVTKKFNYDIQLNVTIEEAKVLVENAGEDKRLISRIKVLEYLMRMPKVPEKQLIKDLKISKAVLTTLMKHGIITRTQKESYRDPFDIDKIEKTQNLLPNFEQQKAIYSIGESIRQCESEIYLLHGVTGSGKTEVYMQVIEQALALGQQAIVLIPEISLTPQTVNRFIGRFGENVGVMHSKLSSGEKYDQWRKAKEGRISIMVGPRSAIFAPFDNLGVIIIDEEHETSYKSSQSPRYHAREVAIMRGDLVKCPVVLGSATPLIESYYKAVEGKYKLFELNNKAHEAATLDVEVVDMRDELTHGNKSMFSSELKHCIEEALSKGEQIILFLNRRGFANFVSCRQCGFVGKCDNCDVPYTYHKNENKLLCHYCGKGIKNYKVCPSCGSKYIKDFGVGTQKVENNVNKEFPNAKVIRMDLDTTTGKNSYQNMLEQFGRKEADILIGTQMVAKGHHFENVTVVGVVAADLSLFINDFRASEKTFQLVTQVTGRAGRGRKKGKAIIQTYSPEHYSIQFAKDQDYKGFYEEEIKYRKVMGYPPYNHILDIMFFSEDEKRLIKDAYALKDILTNMIGNHPVKLLGPTPANISKVKKVYRWKIMAKSNQYKLLLAVAKQLRIAMKQSYQYKHITLQVDINAMTSF